MMGSVFNYAFFNVLARAGQTQVHDKAFIAMIPDMQLTEKPKYSTLSSVLFYQERDPKGGANEIVGEATWENCSITTR